jgi:hypothetical protein
MSQFTVAMNHQLFADLFRAVEEHFAVTKNGSTSSGAFSASYDVGAKLHGGSVSLTDAGTIKVQDLEVVNDPTNLSVGVTIPDLTIGGFCIVPDLIHGGCALTAPKVCIFHGRDITLALDLKGILDFNVNVESGATIRHFANPDRTPAMTDLDAEIAKVANQWQLFAAPKHVDVTLNVAASIDALLEDTANNVFNNLLGGAPQWIKDAFWAIVGPIVDFLKKLVGIVGTVADWVLDLFKRVFNFVAFLETAIADHFANKYPVHKFNDPYPATKGDPAIPLNPLLIPILNPAVVVNAAELVITADIGG